MTENHRWSVSVVLPTYNECDWLPGTIEAVSEALTCASIADGEVVVVDDGSTDATAQTIAGLSSPYGIRYIRTENQGRFLARSVGVEAARHELVLFIDSRVRIDRTALEFALRQMDAAGCAQVWNADVRTATDMRPWTRFWDAVTFVAWYRYLGSPRTTSYGAEEFDRFPKGTSLFLAPTTVLRASVEHFDSWFERASLSNDDTTLIAGIAQQQRIHISPQFGGIYHPKATLPAFVRSSFHRGTVLVDGHIRTGSRYGRAAVASPILGLFLCTAMWRAPKATAAAASAAVLGSSTVAVAKGLEPATAASFWVLAPLFGVTYGAGILRGLWLGLRSRGSRRASRLPTVQTA